MQLNDKVIVITGAAGGIGRALAQRFLAERPAWMQLTDLHAEAVQAVAADLDPDGSRIGASACDVSDANAVAQLVAAVEQRCGRIDLFCSNAGVFINGGADAGAKAWQLSLDINLMAHVHAVNACLPGMLARGEGYFLHTISAAGLLAQIGSAPYTVSKHAAVGFAEWVAITHGQQGIKVTALCPQGVQTAMLDDIDNVDSVASDGVVTPETVAECALAAIHAEQFLALPHPGVAHYFQRKAADHDRWIRGMQRFQASLERQ
jgi:NAD(P)-dependent dehydrogenase (short-subunit alcohol dehydrogenase family)